jgi:hypothetical protein
MWDLAADLLSHTRDSVTALTLLCSRFAIKQPPGQSKDFFLRCGLRPPDAFAQAGPDAEVKGRFSEAVRCFVAAGDTCHARALDVGLSFLKREIVRNEWDANSVNEVLESLSCIPLVQLDARKRSDLLAIAFYVAGFNCAWLGYSCLMPHIVSTFNKLVRESGSSLGIDAVPLLTIQALLALQQGDFKRATTASNSISDGSAAKKVVNSWITTAMECQQQKKPTVAMQESCNVIRLSGGSLPSRRPTASAISGEDCIKGQVIEVDRRSIPLAEALMWSRVCPFPPFGVTQMPCW